MLFALHFNFAVKLKNELGAGTGVGLHCTAAALALADLPTQRLQDRFSAFLRFIRKVIAAELINSLQLRAWKVQKSLIVD